ncbi:MAG TPA: hypothetical protein P5555_18955 [Candidatus Paceibacterota bacterium]|nr:hypothetical protein [Verrucomicrobiota bacterium]HOX04357.1 hypothetical protein [Verrucomicrobiota bacterium]HRZ47264.1 hypothetical protein [Candidatus Paceibacterota bacterium]HRZ92729.1 hypothetical protein [Candidatus Paceibacterota bacterium]
MQGLEAQSTPQPSTAELLQRLLTVVEPPKRKRGLEIACALVLSLATTASAWCAYQSKLWGGAQMGRANAAVRASREGAVTTLAVLQARMFDASMFIAYMEARFDSNWTHEAFLAQRFRPEMKPAFEAWLKLDPLNNPSAPPSPLHMAEYAQKEAAEVARQEAIAAEGLEKARQARQVSDNYVLLTVLFASVLFFGGIARVFDSRLLRIVFAVFAVVLLLGTLSGLLTMPICRE